MSTLQEIVVKRLAELDLSPIVAATRKGLPRDFIRDIVRGKKATITAEKLWMLAEALDLDAEALARNEAIPARRNEEENADDRDDQMALSVTRTNASFPPKYQSFPRDGYIPLRGQSVGGPNGRFVLNGAEVGRLFVPPMLEGVEGAYAVRVYGTSMEPRFKAGETVWINPNEPVRAGDDVIVQVLTDEENDRESYIKEFRSQSHKVTRLWQHNPDEGERNELEFDTKKVFSVHKIVFHATV
ncbi:S24 family peptidase [Rhizobium sp. GCM10022189]|uniref:S24 family peptidase n=1 Tax=Rhizobium sp. GCM10022189 TaxID=3252654 RepID=UPI00360DC7AF